MEARSGHGGGGRDSATVPLPCAAGRELSGASHYQRGGQDQAAGGLVVAPYPAEQ